MLRADKFAFVYARCNVKFARLKAAVLAVLIADEFLDNTLAINRVLMPFYKFK